MLPLFEDLDRRGLVKQTTDPTLAQVLAKGGLTLYAGFDPTADSLHIGHLLPLLNLRRFQLAGHRPIAVVGGATGLIGDPGGKSAERQLLTKNQVEKNLQGIRGVISRFLDLEGPHAARVVNNAEWFEGVSYLDFLRDVGKHFTVNHMITKESVRARLEDREHGISYTEFSYMLLQAFDFYTLNERYKCTLQIGGSDQWGNITAGCELIRRINAAHGKPPVDVYGLTCPLVTKADGTKFGKTETGAIWLDADKTSPYQFYQFLLNTADSDVLTFLKYFTFLSHERLAELEASAKITPEKREAQTTLARELTTLVHGSEAVTQAERAAKALFGTQIKDLDSRTLSQVLADAPSIEKPKSFIDNGIALAELVVESKLCPSKGAARKEIEAGGIYVNNERVANPSHVLRADSLIAGRHLVLRKGKKNYVLVHFN